VSSFGRTGPPTAEWNHFVDRSASFLQNLSSCRRSKTWCGFPSICPKLISRASQYFGFPLLLLTVEVPKVPLSGGLFGFVALRCSAEECAFSLSTQAQDHVWDLAEYKRVEPAHCPTGVTSGGAGCERNIMWGIPPPFFHEPPRGGAKS
jgi:hypothetical protein